MLTTAQAAVLLGLSRRQVQHLCRTGTIAAKRHGRDWILTRAAVEQARTRPAPGWPARPKA